MSKILNYDKRVEIDQRLAEVMDSIRGEVDFRLGYVEKELVAVVKASVQTVATAASLINEMIYVLLIIGLTVADSAIFMAESLLDIPRAWQRTRRNY